MKGEVQMVDVRTLENGKWSDLKEVELNALFSETSKTPIPLGNVTGLNLFNNWLTNLPATIDNLTQLKYLYLDENNLTTLPIELCNLTKLEYLCLENNPLQKTLCNFWKDGKPTNMYVPTEVLNFLKFMKEKLIIKLYLMMIYLK